jgi:hypothetical protein
MYRERRKINKRRRRGIRRRKEGGVEGIKKQEEEGNEIMSNLCSSSIHNILQHLYLKYLNTIQRRQIS